MKVTFYSERPYCFVVDSDSDIMPELVTHLDGLAVAGATMEFLKVISHTLNFTVKLMKPSLEVSGIYDPKEMGRHRQSWHCIANTKYSIL